MKRIGVLFILPRWVKAFPMVRVFLFIAVCFSVLFFIKEPEEEEEHDDDDDDDVESIPSGFAPGIDDPVFYFILFYFEALLFLFIFYFFTLTPTSSVYPLDDFFKIFLLAADSQD